MIQRGSGCSDRVGKGRRSHVRRMVWLCGPALGTATLVISGAAMASETIAYTYDALGRLVQVARSGSVNNGVNSSYTYDPADNRTNVTVGGGSGGGGNPPPNQPPVTQSDNAGTIQACTGVSWNVVANDTDPEGHYPLSLVGIQSVSPAGYGDAYVQSSTHVLFYSSGPTGGVQITYVVQDSLGATATGVMGVIVEGACW